MLTRSDWSDAQLVSAAQAGDTSAFDELITRHQDRVFALAYHLLGNAEDAADVQQESFLRAWTKLRGFCGQAAFGTWLHRITVNLCISWKRQSRPISSLESDETGLNEPDSTDSQTRVVNAVVVRGVLDGMPPKHRVLLVLREVEEMSIEEIAQVTDSSVEAVRKQLWRVRKLFGERLRQQLGDGPR